MEDIPRKILCSLIREQSTSIIYDPAKFRNLLIDYSKGKYKKERKCLSDALSEGIPEILHTKKDQLAYPVLSQQFSRKLIDDLGITHELAKWTVDSWALALGVIQDPSVLEESVITEIDDHIPRDYTVTIDSNPPRAKIFLNGIQKGVTPLILKNLEFGRYQIQLVLDGYESRNQEFETRSNIDQNIVVTLIKKPVESGSITIETYPSDAEITLNSKKFGRTNKTVWNLSEGYYEVRLVLPGHRDIVRQLQLQQGDNVKIRESFVPELDKIPANTPGIVSVDSSPPRAAVYLDDEFIGNTPLIAREISPGNHSVAIRLSSYEEIQDRFHISPGEDRFIYEALVKKKSSGIGIKALGICFVIALIFVVYIFLPSTDPNTPEGWIEKGSTYYNDGKYPEALDAFNSAIAEDSSNKFAWSWRGDTLDEMNREQEALDAYARALSIDPNYAIGWSNKGYVLIKLGKYQESLEAYHFAIANDPNNDISWSGKGAALYQLGRYQEALEAYDRALEINPNLSYALEGKRRAEQELNVNTLAQTKIQNLNQIQDFVSQGAALADDERYEEAIQFYDQGLALIGNDNDIEKAPMKKNLLGLKVFALNKLGRIDEATQVSKLITQG